MKNATPIIKEACNISDIKYPEEIQNIDPRMLIRLTIQRCIDITNGSIEVEPDMKVSGEGAILIRSYFGI